MKQTKRSKIPSFPLFFELKVRITKELVKNVSDWEFSNKPFLSNSVNISGVLGSFIRKIGRKFLENIFEMIW